MGLEHDPQLPNSQDDNSTPEEIQAQLDNYIEAKRQKGFNFFERRELRLEVLQLKIRLLSLYDDPEKNAAMIQLLEFAVRVVERLAEPPLVIDENIRRIERGSTSDIRMLVQSEFMRLDLSSTKPFDLDIFLMEELPVSPSSYRKLKIPTRLLDLPQVKTPWVDISKFELLKMMQKDDEGLEVVKRILVTLRKWEEKMSAETGVEIGVRADGLIAIIVEPQQRDESSQ